MDTTYLTCAETAKLVRQALKARWPTLRASVTSKVYSGGASIRVHYVDGPPPRVVAREVKRFEGADFDGMIDLKTYKTGTLNGSPVHFGADYVFVSRDESQYDSLKAQAEAIIRSRCDLTPDDRFCSRYVREWAVLMVRSLDFTKHDLLEDAFQRVVINQNW